MKELSWKSLEQWILLLITVLPAINHGGRTEHHSCPRDPESSARDCLVRYTSLFASMGIQNLYTGIDAEVIRHICSELMNSIICAHNLKEVCPDTEHTDISVVMEDIVSMYELCSQKNIIEVYSRNQNCFTRQSATSEECYHKFRAATEENIMTQALTGDQPALTQLCNHIDTMTSCVKTRVIINCNQEAANMVPLLVRPSIKMSEHCRNDTLYKSTTTTSYQPGATPSVKHHDQRWVESSSTHHTTTWLLLLSASLISLLTLIT